jgi:hypothetical protein
MRAMSVKGARSIQMDCVPQAILAVVLTTNLTKVCERYGAMCEGGRRFPEPQLS